MTGSRTEEPNAGPVEPGLQFATDADELETVRERTTAFVQSVVDRSGADGVVVRLAGDLDSTVTAALAVDALGAERVHGVVLPCTLGSEADAHDAEAIAELLGVEATRVQLHRLLATFRETVGVELAPSAGTVATMNVVARLRMTCVYLVANASHRLVVGSCTRTDRLLGDPTKYGDGAADLFPLGDLFETEVRALAGHLDVPEFVLEKSRRAERWAGHADEPTLDLPAETVDRALALLVDSDATVEETATALGADAGLVERVAARQRGTRHKRHRPRRPGRTRSSA